MGQLSKPDAFVSGFAGTGMRICFVGDDLTDDLQDAITLQASIAKVYVEQCKPLMLLIEPEQAEVIDQVMELLRKEVGATTTNL